MTTQSKRATGLLQVSIAAAGLLVPLFLLQLLLADSGMAGETVTLGQFGTFTVAYMSLIISPLVMFSIIRRSIPAGIRSEVELERRGTAFEWRIVLDIWRRYWSAVAITAGTLAIFVGMVWISSAGRDFKITSTVVFTSIAGHGLGRPVLDDLAECLDWSERPSDWVTGFERTSPRPTCRWPTTAEARDGSGG